MIKLGIKCDIEDRSHQTYMYMLYKSGLLIRCNKKKQKLCEIFGAHYANELHVLYNKL